MDSPYYFHAPAYPSRAAVLDVGLKCTHSCKFCYYSYLDQTDDQFRGMRHARFQPLDHCLEVLGRLKANGFLAVDITGGEPTLHPDIIEIVRHASRDLGLSVRLITLGQFLMRPMKNGRHERLIDDLLEAGLTNVLFSCHAVDETLFHAVTGESWARQRAAMVHLDGLGFQYCANTVAFADNFHTLEAIAAEIATHNVYLHNFIVMNAYHQWSEGGRAEGVQARYGDIAPHLRRAVAILERAGIGVNIRYAPLCTLAGLERNIVGVAGVRYDPYEWMNNISHFGGAPAQLAQRLKLQPGQPDEGNCLGQATGEHAGHALVAARGDRATGAVTKLFPSNCTNCQAMTACDGLAPSYLEAKGQAEVIPYLGGPAAGVLTEQRKRYLPPFLVKRRPDADMRAAVRRALTPSPLPAEPKVSIVVTCYNYGRYLREAMDSALGQTWRNLEIILVDDGSTDDTPAIAAEYAARHPGRVISLRQDNSGQPACSRNAGMALATGELILPLDADDILLPSMVEECVAVLQAHPEAAIAYTATRNFGDVDELFVPRDYEFSTLLYVNLLAYCSLFRREVWEDVGGYRTNVRGCEDWDFWIHAGGLGYFARLLPRPLIRYRRHGAGIFATDVEANRKARYRQIVLNNADLYPPQMVAQARSGADITQVIG